VTVAAPTAVELAGRRNRLQIADYALVAQAVPPAFFRTAMRQQAAEKVLRDRREKFATQLDALYALAEPWGYIFLPPIFALSGTRKTFSAAWI